MAGNRFLPPVRPSATIVDPAETDESTPHWCFSGLMKGYTLGDIPDKVDAHAFARSIEARRNLTWRDLMKNRPESNGIAEWEIKGNILVDLPAKFKSKSKILKFYAGKKNGRVFGFRDGRVFEAVIVDFKFTSSKHK